MHNKINIPRWLAQSCNWESQEEDTAKKYKGKRQIGSGAFAGYKEDIKTDTYLIQTKFTSKKSISIKLNDLRNLIKHAFQINKKPMMRITFLDYPISFILIPEEE